MKVSSFLAKKPHIMFGIQQAWLQFGYSILDLHMASWVIRRPEWLLKRSRKELYILEPSLPLVREANLHIAARLITMHRILQEGSRNSLVPDDSMWSVLRELHYDRLCSLIKKGDPNDLALFLAQLFRTKTVNGYTYGSTFDTWPHRWHYLPVQIELSIVQLAEALGLIRTECHEQGEIAFWRELSTEEELIEKLENFFGFRIEQPRHGDPRGIMFGGRFLTRETCSHLYTAHKIHLAIKRNGISSPVDIVEIGGGFGGTCYWLRKVLGDCVRRYVIVDLPEVSLVQAFFLGSEHPDHLILPTESRKGIKSPIHLVRYTELSEIDFRPNILLNQDSMPEMPETEVERYLQWAADNLDGLFLSFNQETYSPNGSQMQVFIPAVLARFPRLRRISRETSWDRRGYVEEVYETVS